jgi:hypothetical protein
MVLGTMHAWRMHTMLISDDYRPSGLGRIPGISGEAIHCVGRN